MRSRYSRLISFFGLPSVRSQGYLLEFIHPIHTLLTVPDTVYPADVVVQTTLVFPIVLSASILLGLHPIFVKKKIVCFVIYILLDIYRLFTVKFPSVIDDCMAQHQRKGTCVSFKINYSIQIDEDDVSHNNRLFQLGLIRSATTTTNE